MEATLDVSFIELELGLLGLAISYLGMQISDGVFNPPIPLMGMENPKEILPVLLMIEARLRNAHGVLNPGFVERFNAKLEQFERDTAFEQAVADEEIRGRPIH